MHTLPTSTIIKGIISSQVLLMKCTKLFNHLEVWLPPLKQNFLQFVVQQAHWLWLVSCPHTFGLIVYIQCIVTGWLTKQLVGCFCLFLFQLLDMKIFVDTDSDIRLVRRLRRDISERGREIEGVIKQYNKFVKPAFEQYIEPTMRLADIVVPRGGCPSFITLQRK